MCADDDDDGDDDDGSDDDDDDTIVLLETSDPSKTRQGTGHLVTMEDTKVSDTEWELTVGT